MNKPHQPSAKKRPITLAIDAMGGDNAPSAPLMAGRSFLKKNPHARLLLVGDEKKIAPFLASYKLLRPRVNVVHTSDVVRNDDKPSNALRAGKNSSIALAVNATAKGDADAVVSGGNTGALMAFAMFGFGRIAGIDRPAICSSFPTMKGATCVLDLGAQLKNTAEELCQYALLGSGFARCYFDIDRPTVGILNVGHEANKGLEHLQKAAAILRAKQKPYNNIHFHGFIEGNDIANGTVNVCVTEGFVGNVFLKTSEGIGRMVSRKLRDSFSSNVMTKFAYLLAWHQLKKMRDMLDPRLYNGAPLLGLNKIAVKSHGSADKIAFGNALTIAHQLVTTKMIDSINKNLQNIII